MSEDGTGDKLRDFILGAQDGIVNVLGLILGVASATYETKVVLISGIAGLFAESISMGAVAFTSSQAAHDYYRRVGDKKEIRHYKSPSGSGWFVFFATIFGSLVPLIPFFFMPVKMGIIASVTLSGLILFIIGAAKGKLTTGHPVKTGIEMLVIGLVAAIAGYVIGTYLGVVIH